MDEIKYDNVEPLSYEDFKVLAETIRRLDSLPQSGGYVTISDRNLPIIAKMQEEIASLKRQRNWLVGYKKGLESERDLRKERSRDEKKWLAAFGESHPQARWADEFSESMDRMIRDAAMADSAKGIAPDMSSDPETLRAVIAGYEDALAEKEEYVKALEEQAARWRDLLSEKNRKIADLEKALAGTPNVPRLIGENEAFRAELAAVKAELQRRGILIDGLRQNRMFEDDVLTENRKLKDQIDGLEAQVKMVKDGVFKPGGLERLEGDVAALKTECSRLANENAVLSGNMAEAIKSKEEAWERASLLNSTIYGWQLRGQTAENNAAKVVDELNVCKQLIASNEAEKRRLIESYEQQLRDLRGTILEAGVPNV